MRIIILWLILILTSCQQEGLVIERCYKDDPISELNWLSDVIEDYSISMMPIVPSIYEYKYLSNTYFASKIGERFQKIYHCEGEVFCTCDSLNQVCLINFEEEATLVRLIWEKNSK